jgi:hypothetical protein
MAMSNRALVFAKWMYWILLGFILLYTCYLLFQSGRAITGVLFFIFGSMLLYMMYKYYFPPGDPSSQWPPYITACPDYLTLIAPNACADYVGLHTPILQQSDPTHPPAPTDTKHVFSATGTVHEKAAKAQQYGLSWEGIN